jgi:hypothetical protein
MPGSVHLCVGTQTQSPYAGLAPECGTQVIAAGSMGWPVPLLVVGQHCLPTLPPQPSP